MSTKQALDLVMHQAGEFNDVMRTNRPTPTGNYQRDCADMLRAHDAVRAGWEQRYSRMREVHGAPQREVIDEREFAMAIKLAEAAIEAAECSSEAFEVAQAVIRGLKRVVCGRG